MTEYKFTIQYCLEEPFTAKGKKVEQVVQTRDKTINSKSEHEARRMALYDYINNGYQVKSITLKKATVK